MKRDADPASPRTACAPAGPTGRREFLDTAIAGTGVALGMLAAYPTARFLAAHSTAAQGTARVGGVDEIAPGSSRTLAIGETPVLVLRDERGDFHAFVATCPHLGCVVRYVDAHRMIECACHGGRFSTSGRNVAGPPPRPLTALRTEIVDGVLFVSTT